MKSIILFVLSVFGYFYLIELMDQGNLFANWVLVGLGIIFIGWVGKQIWGNR